MAKVLTVTAGYKRLHSLQQYENLTLWQEVTMAVEEGEDPQEVQKLAAKAAMEAVEAEFVRFTEYEKARAASFQKRFAQSQKVFAKRPDPKAGG